jgi:hypothetical protein
MKLYILFQGFGLSHKEWNTKTNFLEKLQKKGKVFIHHNKWIEQTQNYNLSYLEMETFIKNAYEEILYKFPKANSYELIPIGFSFGGLFALAFSKIYKRYCKYCVLLDNPHYFTLKNNKNRIKYTKKMLGDRFKILSNNKFKTLLNKNSEYLLDWGVISFGLWIQNNIVNNKLPIPVYGFYNISYPNKYIKEFNIYDNDELLYEINKLSKENPKKYKYYFGVNISHMIFQDKEFSKIILQEI